MTLSTPATYPQSVLLLSEGPCKSPSTTGVGAEQPREALNALAQGYISPIHDRLLRLRSIARRRGDWVAYWVLTGRANAEAAR